MKAKALACVLLATAGCAASPGCLDGLTNERRNELLTWTAAAMSVSHDVPRPRMACVPHDELEALSQAHGYVFAWYLPSPDRAVLINDALTYPENEQYLIHEFAHHLQTHHGFAGSRDEMEAQAWALTRSWLDGS